MVKIAKTNNHWLLIFKLLDRPDENKINNNVVILHK